MYLTDCLDSGLYHGPTWRMEPGDLFIPVDSIEEEATLTCDAKGIPPAQYRYAYIKTFGMDEYQPLYAAIPPFFIAPIE